MNSNIAITITALSLSSCGSIGGYTENHTETKVSFSEYSAHTNNYLNKQTRLKVAQTGLVSGSTLLYSAQGSSSPISTNNSSFNVTYPLWINESEVDDVEYAIDKYRQWQKQETPDKYLLTLPINEYVSEWMNGVTFKFGLYSTKQGRDFLSVCYEFSESGICTFTYMIDEQSVELLSNDLQKFKQHSFELGS
ncbi:hypothetical protein ESZ36_21750 [Colwellia demingiae]|uniref:Uncharacterized protein n=1 Tax=Colwellia demingiae TaxID=89401 RepID=A0A5C6Q461_9GAMM|nr:hypothetical protein [Colwellia demingiae]TWX63705.1 hypothetical protein ESZ36_21750 [Colwellia demingiae]